MSLIQCQALNNKRSVFSSLVHVFVSDCDFMSSISISYISLSFCSKGKIMARCLPPVCVCLNQALSSSFLLFCHFILCPHITLWLFCWSCSPPNPDVPHPETWELSFPPRPERGEEKRFVCLTQSIAACATLMMHALKVFF